jgi:hypothetical protein
MILTAPALVGIPRRSLHHPSAHDRAIRAALQSMRGVDALLPILYDGVLLGHAWGEPLSSPGFGRVWWRDPKRDGYRCAITTYDGVVGAFSAGKQWTSRFSKACTTAVVANNWYDLWPVGGSPTAGTYTGAARTAVQKGDTSVGAMFAGGNVSTDLKYLVAAFASSTASTPTLHLYDRVLTYEACTFVAGNQVMTNTLPALRYIGAGEGGLKIIVTAQTVLGATVAAFTQLRYTDQDGNALQVMPVAFGVNCIVSAAAPTATLGARVVSPSVSAATLTIGPYMPLLAGDGGVRLINDYTMSAANTGTLAFVLGRPLAVIPIATAGVTQLLDQIVQVAGMRRVFDGACLSFLSYHLATTALTYQGGFDFVWG